MARRFRYGPVIAGLFSVALAACQQTPTSGLPEDTGSPSTKLAADDVVLLLRFDGNLKDESPYHHVLEFSGTPDYRRACDDEGLELHGRAYATVPFHPALEPKQVTVEVWMSPKLLLGNGSDFVPLVVKYAGNFWNTVDGYDLWYQNSGGGGRVGFGIGTEGGRLRKHASLTTHLQPGHLYHIAGTFDGTEARLYVNGEQVAATPYEQPLAYLGGEIRIGGGILHTYYSSSLLYYEGLIDQVTIFARALSAEEIAARSKNCDVVAAFEGRPAELPRN